jgi:hypothetical protein
MLKGLALEEGLDGGLDVGNCKFPITFTSIYEKNTCYQ